MLIVIVIASIIGCSKDGNKMSDPNYSTDSVVVSVGQCVTKKYSGDTTIVYCLDSVVNDNRCPKDVLCSVAGYAVVRFNININGFSHEISLATIKLPYVANDTLVAGFKIQLFDLIPRLSTTQYNNYQNSYKNYQAILKIKKV